MTTARDSSYIWVTWITSLLAADKQCEWGAWFKAHHKGYDKVPSDFDLVGWTATHGEMVRARAAELRGEGWTVSVEDQNWFSLKGRAATLGGKADIVAARDGQALVVDCKSGKQRNSDAFQVLTYMLVLPLTHEACRGRTLAGEVQYKELRRPIEPGRLTDEVKALIRATIERVGGPVEPPRVASPSECRWCDITAADCPERDEGRHAETTVEHDLF